MTPVQVFYQIQRFLFTEHTIPCYNGRDMILNAPFFDDWEGIQIFKQHQIGKHNQDKINLQTPITIEYVKKC